MSDGFPHTTIDATQFVFKFLRNTTTGGTVEMVVNASSTAVQNFFYEVPTGKNLYLYRSNIHIIDAGIRPSRFGALAALTNGLTVDVLDSASGSSILDFCDGEPLKKNTHFSELAGIDLFQESTASDDALRVRWTVRKSTDLPLTLKPGQRLNVGIQDDLTGIDEFRWMIQVRFVDV